MADTHLLQGCNYLLPGTPITWQGCNYLLPGILETVQVVGFRYEDHI